MDYRLDEVDRRIIYRLMQDSRNTSAPVIAEEVNVSAGTIRNRIQQLEEHGIITGYHLGVDFERVGGKLTNVFVCSAPVPDREKLAKQALQIPGVVNVRELMAGRENLHVAAVGSDMDDITRISRALSTMGLEIEEEDLLHREYQHPYHPFGPEESRQTASITDLISLAGDAEVLELTVHADAPIAGKTLKEADSAGLIDENVLVIAIERDGVTVTPKGRTEIRPDDLVTVFCQNGAADDVLTLFAGEATP